MDALERRARIERSKLRAMIDYAYHEGCRHWFLLSYFGDAKRVTTCQACDRCVALPALDLPAVRPARQRGLGGRRRKARGARRKVD